MTAADLEAEFDCWKVGLRRCGCGSAVVLTYEPGSTGIYCIRERRHVFALPDWQPKQTHDQWNEKQKQE